MLGGKVRDRVKVYGWIGGDHPSEVLSAALERKQQGFTAVKMNGTGLSFIVVLQVVVLNNSMHADAVSWIDSPDVLKGTVERVRQVRFVTANPCI